MTCAAIRRPRPSTFALPASTALENRRDIALIQHGNVSAARLFPGQHPDEEAVPQRGVDGSKTAVTTWFDETTGKTD